jgi:hypothetical protein
MYINAVRFKFPRSCIVDIMVGMLASSAVGISGFETWLCQSIDYKIDICHFSAKHAALQSD